MANIKITRKMKVGFYIQCPDELKEDEGKLTELININFKKEARRLLQKSVRVLKWNMQSGYNGDDFVMNRFTVMFTGRAYKISRIIKNMLLK